VEKESISWGKLWGCGIARRPNLRGPFVGEGRRGYYWASAMEVAAVTRGGMKGLAGVSFRMAEREWESAEAVTGCRCEDTIIGRGGLGQRSQPLSPTDAR